MSEALTEARVREVSADAQSNTDLTMECTNELVAGLCTLALSALSAPAKKQLTAAWMGYWPGAGSVDSTTHVTRSEHEATRWKAEGAEITELVERTSALGTAPAEPVAWQLRHRRHRGTDAGWDTFGSLPSFSSEADADGPWWDKRPLYASPAPANAAEIRAGAFEEAARAGGDTLLPKHPILAQMVRNAIRALSEATDGH